MPGPYNLFTGGRFGLGVESWDTFLIIEDICPPLHLLLETRLPYILGRVENLIIYIVFHWIALVPSFILYPTLQMLKLNVALLYMKKMTTHIISFEIWLEFTRWREKCSNQRRLDEMIESPFFPHPQPPTPAWTSPDDDAHVGEGRERRLWRKPRNCIRWISSGGEGERGRGGGNASVWILAQTSRPAGGEDTGTFKTLRVWEPSI